MDIRCAPYYPSSNGAVKRFDQTFKQALRASEKDGKTPSHRPYLLKDSPRDPLVTSWAKLANHHILSYCEGENLSVLVMLGNLFGLFLTYMFRDIQMNECKSSANLSEESVNLESGLWLCVE